MNVPVSGGIWTIGSSQDLFDGEDLKAGIGFLPEFGFIVASS